MSLFIGPDNSVIYDELKDAITDAYINTGVTMTFTVFRPVCEDGIMAATTTLTSASNPFVVGDVGRSIVVVGAGQNGSDLRTTIAAFVSAGQVTLSTAASVAVSGAQVRMSITDATAVSMTYVTSSDGKYVGTIDEEVSILLKNEECYWVEVTVDAGSDRKDFRVLKETASYRT